MSTIDTTTTSIDGTTSNIYSRLGTIEAVLDAILADQVGEISFLAAIAALEASIAAVDTTLLAQTAAIIAGFAGLALTQASQINLLNNINNNLLALNTLLGTNLTALINQGNAAFFDNTGKSVFTYTDLNTAVANRSVFKSFYNTPAFNRLGSVFQQPNFAVTGGDYTAFISTPLTMVGARGNPVGETGSVVSLPSITPNNRMYTKNIP